MVREPLDQHDHKIQKIPCIKFCYLVYSIYNNGKGL